MIDALKTSLETVRHKALTLHQLHYVEETEKHNSIFYHFTGVM